MVGTSIFSARRLRWSVLGGEVRPAPERQDMRASLAPFQVRVFETGSGGLPAW